MRYHELVENRTEPQHDITLEDVLARAPLAVKKMKQGVFIYRGMRQQMDIGFADSQITVRRQTYIRGMLYNPIIDSDPAWSAFPKRAKSFICSTDSYTASAYDKGQQNKYYLVVPLGNPIIGICPEMDIQLSFKDGAFRPMNWLTTALFKLKITDGMSTLHNRWKNPTQFNALLNTVQERWDTATTTMRQPPSRDDDDSDEWYRNKDWTRLFSVNNSIRDTLWAMYNPETNNFSAVPYRSLSVVQNREIWFSDQAYFLAAQPKNLAALRNLGIPL